MPTNYTVNPGDCISSIALDSGFFPDTIWNHPDNAALKQQRKTAHILLPGDVVTIPDLQPRTVDKPDGKHHRFRRKGVPEILKLQLLDEHQKPRAGVAYRLVVDGKKSEGSTDGDGRLKEWISPDAAVAELLIDPNERYQLNLGHLEPVSTDLGVRARLVNLGFLASVDAPDDAVGMALGEFQTANGLSATGNLDETTRNQLLTKHGC